MTVATLMTVVARDCELRCRGGMLATMADLEELALKRDRGFLVRLALMLLVGLMAGAFLYGQLIGDAATGCMARTIGGGDGARSTDTPDNSVR